jgi:hypothetical protein
MFDTNSINQGVAVAQDAAAQVKANWPAICLAGGIIVREICKVNGWLEYVCGKIIAHGGIGLIIKKLLWNPPADEIKKS